MIARLAGLAIDARVAINGPRNAGSHASAARWIAANALAVRGVRVTLEGDLPRAPRVLALHASTFTAAIAALAAVPALLDAATVPRRWRLLLCALGVPTLEGARSTAVHDGASVLECTTSASCELAVDRELDGFRVRIAPARRMLVA